MNCRLLTCLVILAGATHASPLHAGENKIRIVTTTSTLASLVREVAGDRAEIHSVASPKRNLHFISPTPKDVLKVKKANVFVHHGFDTEPWRESLLNAAGNPDFFGEGKGLLDVSKGIELLEVPENLSRAEGDIHLYGNTHYWLDPFNAKIMVDSIAEGLSQWEPASSVAFKENARKFNEKIDRKLEEWKEQMNPYKGSFIVTYHGSWPYFAKRFSLKILGQLEPKPGIPPAPKHLAALTRSMKEREAKVIIREPYLESRTPQKAAKETGASVVTLTQSVDGAAGTGDYFSMMDFNVRELAKALGQKNKGSAS